jgi:hypothetical protein
MCSITDTSTPMPNVGANTLALEDRPSRMRNYAARFAQAERPQRRQSHARRNSGNDTQMTQSYFSLG